MDFFGEQEKRPTLQSVTVEGVELVKGSRVMLWPRSGGDVIDIALSGKVAFVEAIEQDYEERIHLSVTLEDDPGRDLGDDHILGHRFFFTPDEVVPLDPEAADA